MTDAAMFYGLFQIIQENKIYSPRVDADFYLFYLEQNHDNGDLEHQFKQFIQQYAIDEKDNIEWAYFYVYIILFTDAGYKQIKRALYEKIIHKVLEIVNKDVLEKEEKERQYQVKLQQIREEIKKCNDKTLQKDLINWGDKNPEAPVTYWKVPAYTNTSIVMEEPGPLPLVPKPNKMTRQTVQNHTAYSQTINDILKANGQPFDKWDIFS